MLPDGKLFPGVLGAFVEVAQRVLRVRAPRGLPMTDLLILTITVALFAATAGFVRLCERM